MKLCDLIPKRKEKNESSNETDNLRKKKKQRERENINSVISVKYKRTERLVDKNQRKLRKKKERIERG
jgi:hypothetical protein